MSQNMSPRQSAANTIDTIDTIDASSRSRGNLTTSLNSRRSNSTMSNTRRKGSASKDESETEQQGESGTSSVLKEENITIVEPEEEEDENENENENGESGDSGHSATQTHTGARKKAGGKRRRGSAVGNRSRASKTGPEVAAEEGLEETIVKSGADEEADQVQEEEDAGKDSKGGEKLARHRSTSGFKELAGLGLRSLGDGEEEPLVPRRTRRGAVSPNDAEAQQKESGEEHENRRPDSHETDSKTEEDSAIPPEAVSTIGEDEMGEEGVTRCLCGSADENVGLMIQCETCKCWQHCICMGMRTEDDCPDVYFCEQCRPELHIPLLRLLSVLPASRSGKKGGSKGQSGRTSAKDAAKELKEAKEAVLTLAKENERRRKEGREPVTGWSVAQEQEQQQVLLQEQNQMYSNNGQHRRQISESRVRGSRSGSRDELTVSKSPPKRRSTMNSRDSAYGWESIPPELLNEEDEWGSKEESENGGRKRRRTAQEEEGEHRSHSPVGLSSSDGNSKRRTSSAIDAADDGIGQEVREEEEGEEDGQGDREMEEVSNTTLQAKKSAKTRAPREQEASRPKHPNQYTARRAAAAVAAAAAGIDNPGSSSPSPSPSKHRLADGTRKTTSLRDVINNGSQMATPTPNGSQNDYSKLTNPGAPWGMPDHLSHLAYLLPSLTGPEPLIVNLASTKGMPSTSSNKGAPSTATKDGKTDRITRASPQAFQNVSFVEPNTKIKFPGKRTTMGEMRKRIRNILDFVSRLQIESTERERRMKFLGIVKEAKAVAVQETTSAESMEEDEPAQVEENKDQGLSVDAEKPETVQVSDEKDKDTTMKDADAEEIIDESSAVPKDTLEVPSTGPDSPFNNVGTALESVPPLKPTPTLKQFTELYSPSMSLVDELTRELLAFQQRYGTGAFGTSTVMASSGGTY